MSDDPEFFTRGEPDTELVSEVSSSEPRARLWNSSVIGYRTGRIDSPHLSFYYDLAFLRTSLRESSAAAGAGGF